MISFESPVTTLTPQQLIQVIVNLTPQDIRALQECLGPCQGADELGRCLVLMQEFGGQ